MSIHDQFQFPNMLLPEDRKIDFSKSGEATKVINTVSALCGLASKALENFKTGDLPSFDSLATDCSCHLRALRIAAIAQDFLVPHSELAGQIEAAQIHFKAMQIFLKKAGEDLTTWCAKGKKTTGAFTPIVAAINSLEGKDNSSQIFGLQEILDLMGAVLKVDSKIAYLIDAYLLKLVKSYKEVEESEELVCAEKACSKIIFEQHHVFKEVTVPKKLSEEAGRISGNLPINAHLLHKEIYKSAKRQLTDLSIDFLLSETEKFQSPHLFTLLKHNQQLIEGKVELPDFYSLTAAFQVCQEKQIPVLLKVKKCLHSHRHQELQTPFDFGLFLCPKEEGGFEPASFTNSHPNSPVIVVEAKRSGLGIQEESAEEYAKRLMVNFDFMHLCELDGAQHKQYTSDADSMEQKPSEVIPSFKKGEYAEEAKRLDQLRKEAETEGCAFYHQSKMILSHIYADQIGKHRSDPLYEKTAKWIKLISQGVQR